MAVLGLAMLPHSTVEHSPETRGNQCLAGLSSVQRKGPGWRAGSAESFLTHRELLRDFGLENGSVVKGLHPKGKLSVGQTHSLTNRSEDRNRAQGRVWQCTPRELKQAAGERKASWGPVSRSDLKKIATAHKEETPPYSRKTPKGRNMEEEEGICEFLGMLGNPW